MNEYIYLKCNKQRWGEGEIKRKKKERERVANANNISYYDYIGNEYLKEVNRRNTQIKQIKFIQSILN